MSSRTGDFKGLLRKGAKGPARKAFSLRLAEVGSTLTLANGTKCVVVKVWCSPDTNNETVVRAIYKGEPADWSLDGTKQCAGQWPEGSDCVHVTKTTMTNAEYVASVEPTPFKGMPDLPSLGNVMGSRIELALAGGARQYARSDATPTCCGSSLRRTPS